MIFAIPQKKAVWIANTRVASNSIEATMRQGLTLIYLRQNVQLSKIPADWFCFAFVRNPFERLVSAWQYMLLEHTSGGKILGRLRARRHRISDQSSFPEFVNLMATILPSDIDQHFKPQHRVLAAIPREKHIGRFENIDADWQVVAKRLGLSGALLRKNVLPTRPAYQTFYDDGARAKAEKYYAQDCEQFGYSF